MAWWTQSKTDPDAFPVQQMVVLALCRICEPIAFMSIFPYVYYMVQQFKIAKDEQSVAMYVGMVTSAFAIAEFSTGILWGRISDRVGRKPVLLMGLFGTGLSMLLFGFSPNYWTALVARALGGLLNGNIGVINTTVAEVIRKEEHQARAFSLMPGVWCIGSIAGSALGGILADPVRNYPGTFAPGGLLDKFPYLLPNLICFAVAMFSVAVGFLFLEETHEEKKHRRDRGRELGSWLIGLGHQTWIEKDWMHMGRYETVANEDEQESGTPPTTLSAVSATTAAVAPAILEQAEPLTLRGFEPKNVKPSLRGAFTRQVKIVILSYGLLALHTIAADQLLPVMLSLPRSTQPRHLPFFFTSGFEMSTKAIGPTLSGAIQAVGLSWQCLGLPWWTNAIIAIGAALLSFTVREQKKEPWSPRLAVGGAMQTGADEMEADAVYQRE